MFLSLCALKCLPPSHLHPGGSANTELGKADQLHLVGDLCVVAAGCLRGGRGHQQGHGGGPAVSQQQS